MKNSFLTHIIAVAERAIKRFPFVILFLFVTPYLIAVNHYPETVHFSPAVMICLELWLFLGTGLTLLGERLSWRKLWRWLSHIMLIVLLAAFFAWMYYFSDAAHNGPGMTLGINAMLLSVPLLLLTLATDLPKDQHAYWKQILTFGTRLLLTIVFGILLFAAVSLAITAVITLFQTSLSSTIYMDAWLIVTLIFGPIFMLGGFPSLDEPDAITSKVAGILEGIAHFILAPASVIYFIILYAYGLRILITREWPTGMVTPLVLTFSGVALLSYIILRKQIESSKNRNVATRSVFAALILPVIMMFAAMGIRIQDAGWTEPRYLILVAGFILLLYALYMIISKQRRLEALAGITAITLLLTSIGPWGMIDVSKTSQMDILEKVLTEKNILQNGKVTLGSGTLLDEDKEKVSSILYYIKQRHSLMLLQPWFNEDISSKETYEIITMLDAAYSFSLPVSKENCNLTHAGDARQSFDVISGYDVFIANQVFSTVPSPYKSSEALDFSFDGRNFTLQPLEDMQFEIKEGTTVLGSVALRPFLDALINESCAQSNNPLVQEDKMTYTFENDRLRIKMVFNSVNKNKNASSAIYEAFTRLYIDIKQ